MARLITNRREFRHRSQARLCASIGLLALALLQISIASHQFTHLSEHASSICRVCVDQDRFDDDLPVADQVTTFFSYGQTIPVASKSRHTTQRLQFRQPRGPPLS